jgi:hypothetical protein
MRPSPITTTRAGRPGAVGAGALIATVRPPSPSSGATLSFYTVIGCHSLGICTIALLSLLSFSAEMTVPPMAAVATGSGRLELVLRPEGLRVGFGRTFASAEVPNLLANLV